MKNQHYGILGFPWDGGASLGRPGSRYAPQAIREAAAWFKNRIQDQKIYDVEKRKLIDFGESQIIDYGDIDIAAYSWEKTFQNAEAKMSQLLQEKVFPIVLGGDHSISYPLLKALHDHAEGNVGIIQFDAHMDLVDETPVQGRFSQSSQIRRALELPGFNAKNIIQIGVRSYNYPWYAEYLKEIGIVQLTAREVHNMRPEEVIEKALETIQGVDKVFLTFDIDCLDPAFAPGSGANEPGGLTPVQCFSILDGLYEHVHALDIAEVNPLYDHQGITSSMAARVMYDCITTRVSKFNE